MGDELRELILEHLTLDPVDRIRVFDVCLLYYLGWRKNNESSTTVSLAPLPGGTAMVVTCRF